MPLSSWLSFWISIALFENSNIIKMTFIHLICQLSMLMLTIPLKTSSSRTFFFCQIVLTTLPNLPLFSFILWSLATISFHDKTFHSKFSELSLRAKIIFRLTLSLSLSLSLLTYTIFSKLINISSSKTTISLIKFHFIWISCLPEDANSAFFIFLPNSKLTKYNWPQYIFLAFLYFWHLFFNRFSKHLTNRFTFSSKKLHLSICQVVNEKF